MKKLTKNNMNESRRKEEKQRVQLDEAEFCWTKQPTQQKKKKNHKKQREKKKNIYSSSKRPFTS